jgi:uncharacterized metal-binding protein YceD (DUF177 family)
MQPCRRLGLARKRLFLNNNPSGMAGLTTLKIDLKGLANDTETLCFSIGDDYFKALGAEEVRGGSVEVHVDVHKTANRYFNLDFRISGDVTVPCDRCLDDMQQPIEGEGHLTAKLGEDYSEDDDLITVAEDEGTLDATWVVYEFIALSIPVRHVHAPGKCNRDMTKLLEEHSKARSFEGDDSKTMDPRWSGLEQLKNNIKD